MNYKQLYDFKKRSRQECLNMIKSNDFVVLGAATSAPNETLRNLHTIANQVENVTVFSGLEGSWPFQTTEGMSSHIISSGVFFGPGLRAGYKMGNSTYSPGNLHDALVRRMEYRKPNIFFCGAAPMDEQGYFQMPLCLMGEREALEAADIVVFEVNPQLPRVNGMTEVHIDEVDYVVEVNYPPNTLPDTEIGPVEQTIGEYIASLINDGDCLQLGIGGMPNAAAAALKDKKDLGLHTEMFTSAMGEMIRAGIITGERKNFNKGRHVGVFALGNLELYETLSKDPRTMMVPVTYGNDPFVVARNDNLVSVNSTLEMDLTGQACSESIGSIQYSGTGGATDFAYGALHSKGGRGILAFPSTAKGGTVSKIRPQLTTGAVVTISRNLVDYVITEYGIAHLRGRTVSERVKNLIEIAHPDFRKELEKEARKLLLI